MNVITAKPKAKMLSIVWNIQKNTTFAFETPFLNPKLIATKLNMNAVMNAEILLLTASRASAPDNV